MQDIWQNFIDPFIKSNLFLAGATYFAGYIVFRVYKNQKIDEKRNAANIILFEIERAETELAKVSVDKPILGLDGSADASLMPTSSWDKYKHLLASDFITSRNEWDKITNFYAQCKEYDAAVIAHTKILDEGSIQKSVNLQRILADYARTHADDRAKAADAGVAEKAKLESDYEDKRSIFSETLTGSDQYQAPMNDYVPQKFYLGTQKILGIIDRNLSTTSAGVRLKEIAAPREALLTRLAGAFKSRGRRS